MRGLCSQHAAHVEATMKGKNLKYCFCHLRGQATTDEEDERQTPTESAFWSLLSITNA